MILTRTHVTERRLEGYKIVLILLYLITMNQTLKFARITKLLVFLLLIVDTNLKSNIVLPPLKFQKLQNGIICFLQQQIRNNQLMLHKKIFSRFPSFEATKKCWKEHNLYNQSLHYQLNTISNTQCSQRFNLKKISSPSNRILPSSTIDQHDVHVHPSSYSSITSSMVTKCKPWKTHSFFRFNNFFILEFKWHPHPISLLIRSSHLKSG